MTDHRIDTQPQAPAIGSEPEHFDFAAVLTEVAARKASDLHLTAGFPPAIRTAGRVEPMENFPRLSAQQTREVIYGILSEDQRKRFETSHQLDLAYAIPNVARFRLNCYMQRGSVSAAFRLVPGRCRRWTISGSRRC